ncbi:MAG: hypothetical protein BIP78_0335 [Candidatus Bipolaricaulis sibiricus]|uniref:Uncharacterized protein n=1 Tax=Bipolaricaulis sibiricus TaxID=2501609 RepID=A0A410FT05_BIPS1|nr:MAG: hypothetical protein BIP78_0335 [Candidatus Bipolaricaulis sibiricus]
MRTVWTVVLVLALVGASAVAVEPQDAVLLEFLAGTAGGYAGAALGAYTLAWAFSFGATGWEALGRAILGAFLGFAGGTIGGSSLGVIAIGSWLGVEGNVGLAFLGAAAGTGAAFGLGFALQLPETILPFAPPAAAAGATAGFNVGARAREGGDTVR